MKKLVASGRSRDTSRLFPWLLILTIGLVLSLLGNALFAVTAYERSRVVSVPDGDSLDLADGRRIRLLYLGSRPGLERVRYPKPDPLLQRVIVSAGLARSKSTASSEYNRVLKDVQEVAKEAKLGIWSDACR